MDMKIYDQPNVCFVPVNGGDDDDDYDDDDGGDDKRGQVDRCLAIVVQQPWPIIFT